MLLRNILFLCKIKLRQVPDWKFELNKFFFSLDSNIDFYKLVGYFKIVLGLRNVNNQDLEFICKCLINQERINGNRLRLIIRKWGFERIRIVIYSLEALGYLIQAREIRLILISVIEDGGWYDFSLYELKNRVITYEYSSNIYNLYKYSRFLDSKRKNNDFCLHDLIFNKSILVLGPLENYDKSLNESQNYFDIVIFLNLKKDQVDFKYGQNFISIYSYYNAKIYFYKNNYIDDFFTKNLKLIMLKKRPGEIKTDQSNIVYLYEDMKWLLGGPNLLQLLVHNLLIHKPKAINIQNFDVFTSFNNYIKDYKSEGQITTLRNFFFDQSVHGFLSNFIYLKRLLSEKKITTDSNLEKILQMEDVDYLLSIQNLLVGNQKN